MVNFMSILQHLRSQWPRKEVLRKSGEISHLNLLIQVAWFRSRSPLRVNPNVVREIQTDRLQDRESIAGGEHICRAQKASVFRNDGRSGRISYRSQVGFDGGPVASIIRT